MRIALICYPTVGGSGKIATDLGRALGRRGHEVHLLSYDRPGWLPSDSSDDALKVTRIAIPDYPLPHLGAYAMALSSQLAALSQQNRFDLWHLHYAIPHLASAYLAAQFLRAHDVIPPKVVTTLHGTDVTLVGSDPALLLMHRFLLTQSDALTTPSAYLRDVAYQQLGVPTDHPISVIPNFVDTDSFCPLPRQLAQRNRATLLSEWLGTELTASEAASIRVLLHSSNFRPVKRIDDVLSLFVQVQKSLPSSQRCVLFLVGDGPERSRLEALTTSLGLHHSVRFLGMQHDFRELLQHSDVFLLPSALEGFGLSALEALSCGVPVVASRAGGLVEVVQDGQTGFLCPVGDVEAMADAVRDILTHPALHARLSDAARQIVEQRWQTGPIVSLYEALYSQISSR